MKLFLVTPSRDWTDDDPRDDDTLVWANDPAEAAHLAVEKLSEFWPFEQVDEALKDKLDCWLVRELALGGTSSRVIEWSECTSTFWRPAV